VASFNVHIRKLLIYTEPPFNGNGEELRKAVTGKWKNRTPLHGHDSEGRPIYWFPPVRYLPGNIPRLVALDKGMDELENIYSSLGEELIVGSKAFIITATEMLDFTVRLGVSDELHTYYSISPWVALNQRRYEEYQRIGSRIERMKLLEKIFIGNLLVLAKGVGYTVEDKLFAKIHSSKEIPWKFKGMNVLGFIVELTTNFQIPVELGLGKHTSLGFGRFSERTP